MKKYYILFDGEGFDEIASKFQWIDGSLVFSDRLGQIVSVWPVQKTAIIKIEDANETNSNGSQDHERISS